MSKGEDRPKRDLNRKSDRLAGRPLESRQLQLVNGGEKRAKQTASSEGMQKKVS
jgi:hypothetical protein